MGAVSEGDVDGDCEEVVVAVGGLGGRVRLVGIQVKRRAIGRVRARSCPVPSVDRSVGRSAGRYYLVFLPLRG